ncbi:MAG: hypothetical protein A3A33_04385 [Candidatus Yanofskybacteria bacterium RIFCSPLOWO2_01_FULL_49_25]|uniref:Uncharacterized protein n=1 Tax=Candidatus Yanofskybacteria bacterium RIFCSPLOWO2_01_FULL_49_25 TaxID=1802701 RepID=A0A1F8GWN9_9BACT|nr:MAG: hypothetical protein A3A33_04385 [Candidatus Yanofskybacteria bacterium RIFCSPLOWO2_01_FULL_49_25]
MKQAKKADPFEGLTPQRKAPKPGTGEKINEEYIAAMIFVFMHPQLMRGKRGHQCLLRGHMRGNNANDLCWKEWEYLDAETATLILMLADAIFDKIKTQVVTEARSFHAALVTSVQNVLSGVHAPK